MWCDPFAGNSMIAQIRNDMNKETNADFHIDAIDFLKHQDNEFFDGVLLDPPYSPRQVSECYKGFGKEVTNEDTRMSYWSNIKDEVQRIVKPGGKVICFGWNSMGMGKTRGFKMTRILLVPHGGNKNDTIVTVEIKMQRMLPATPKEKEER